MLLDFLSNHLQGNRGGRKLAVDERKTTKGRIALLHFLKSDLHL